MAFDFPSSPGIGQQYSVGGITYVWDGIAWNVAATLGGAPRTAETRNRIVNGAFLFTQENASGTNVVNGGYPADQWYLVFGGLTTIVANHQNVVTPEGSIYCSGHNIATGKSSLAAGDYWIFRQTIEGINVADLLWGTASAKSIVVRFSFNAGVAGTYAFSVQNPTNARSYVASFVAAAGWNKIVIAIPGDTTGTWPKANASGLYFQISPAAGTTYCTAPGVWTAGNFFGATGMTNGAAVNNTNFYIGDCGFHADPDKTGLAPPFQMPDYATELVRCKRYYTRWNDPSTGHGTRYGAAGMAMATALEFPFGVEMRAVPTMAFIVGPTQENCGGIAFVALTTTEATTRVTVTAAGAYRCYGGQYSASARM